MPNGKYNESPEGLWYKEGSVIRIKCDEGYKHKGLGATATCGKGAWSALPVCERTSRHIHQLSACTCIHHILIQYFHDFFPGSEMSCNEPPNIPHAVVLHKYQDIYAAGSEVHYECEDGYSIEGANSRKSVICIAGSWTPAPSCSKFKNCPKMYLQHVGFHNFLLLLLVFILI